jgi:methionyl-tRNA synthetase
VSTETGSAVELSRETNYKFRLSTFHEQLVDHLSQNTDAVWPPPYRAQVLDSLSRGPLEDLSVSRPTERLSWGVRVPGDDEHTIYVWLDALTAYLTAVGFPWKNPSSMIGSGWPASVHVIGKDILRSV